MLNRIAEIRKEQGYSQKQLAIKIRTSPATLCRIERGHRRATPMFRLLLTKVLRVGEATLFPEPKWTD